MKTCVLFLLLTFIYTVGLCQRKYIDLTGCEGTYNSQIKPGWGSGYPVFYDEFNASITKDFVIGPDPLHPLTGPGTLWTDDYYKIVDSDENWAWHWSLYSRAMDPFYDRLGNLLIEPSQVVDDGTNNPLNKFIRCRVNNELPGIDNGDAFRYPVTKYYSSSGILTAVTMNGAGQVTKPENSFVYGWFEIRCKIPVSKYAWPAFWIFNGEGGNTGYNEIDCFELGGNDYFQINKSFSL